MNEYKISGRIGQGAHGVVLKAVNARTKREVALKKLNYRRPAEIVPTNIIREILCLKLVDHPFVVELLDVFTHSLGCVLVFDFMPSGLAEMIGDSERVLTEAEIKTYMVMLLKGLGYIHAMNIMHRDLKPANLLIDKDGVLKIADFGLGRLYLRNEAAMYSHQVATRWYRAPELLYAARNYNKAVDMWAVGCIFAEMVNRCPLFPGDSDIEQLALVLHLLGTPKEDEWPGLLSLPDYNKIVFPESNGTPITKFFPDASSDVVDIIRSILCYDPSKRPSAVQVMKNPYFCKKPLPCLMYNMPKPFGERRMCSANKYIEWDIDVSFQEIFEDLTGLVLFAAYSDLFEEYEELELCDFNDISEASEASDSVETSESSEVSDTSDSIEPTEFHELPMYSSRSSDEYAHGDVKPGPTSSSDTLAGPSWASDMSDDEISQSLSSSNEPSHHFLPAVKKYRDFLHLLKSNIRSECFKTQSEESLQKKTVTSRTRRSKSISVMYLSQNLSI